MLFTRCVSGTRVVTRGQRKSVTGVDFVGYGASVNHYPHDYLTAACAVGLSSAELDEFLLRLDKTIRKAKGEREAAAAGGGREELRVDRVEVEEAANLSAGGGGKVNGSATGQSGKAESAGTSEALQRNAPELSGEGVSKAKIAHVADTEDEYYWDNVD